MSKTFQHRNVILLGFFSIFSFFSMVLVCCCFVGDTSVCMHYEKPNKCNFSFRRSVTFFEQQRNCAYMIATVSRLHFGLQKIFIMKPTENLQIDVDDSDSEVEQEDEYETYSE